MLCATGAAAAAARLSAAWRILLSSSMACPQPATARIAVSVRFAPDLLHPSAHRATAGRQGSASSPGLPQPYSQRPCIARSEGHEDRRGIGSVPTGADIAHSEVGGTAPAISPFIPSKAHGPAPRPSSGKRESAHSFPSLQSPVPAPLPTKQQPRERPCSHSSISHTQGAPNGSGEAVFHHFHGAVGGVGMWANRALYLRMRFCPRPLVWMRLLLRPLAAPAPARCATMQPVPPSGRELTPAESKDRRSRSALLVETGRPGALGRYESNARLPDMSSLALGSQMSLGPPRTTWLPNDDRIYCQAVSVSEAPESAMVAEPIRPGDPMRCSGTARGVTAAELEVGAVLVLRP